MQKPMPAKRKKKCKNCIVTKRTAGYRRADTRGERLMRELDALLQNSESQKDPIEEQLRRCPEAFKAAELLGKLCDRLNYDGNRDGEGHLLPPAGVLIPPLV